MIRSWRIIKEEHHHLEVLEKNGLAALACSAFRLSFRPPIAQ